MFKESAKKVETIIKTNEEPQSRRLDGFQRLKECCLIVGVLSSVLLAVALFTFSPADPSWSQTAWGGQIDNAGGLFGAWLADTLFFVFGSLAYLLPFLFTAGAWVLFRKRSADESIDLMLWGTRLLGLATLILTSSGLADLNFDDIWYFSSGGVVGDVLTSLALPTLNVLGTTLVLLFLWGAGFTLFTGISWLRIVEWLGEKAFSVTSALVNKIRGNGQEVLEPQLEKFNDQEMSPEAGNDHMAGTDNREANFRDIELDESELSPHFKSVTEQEKSAEKASAQGYPIYMPQSIAEAAPTSASNQAELVTPQANITSPQIPASHQQVQSTNEASRQISTETVDLNVDRTKQLNVTIEDLEAAAQQADDLASEELLSGSSSVTQEPLVSSSSSQMPNHFESRPHQVASRVELDEAISSEPLSNTEQLSNTPNSDTLVSSTPVDHSSTVESSPTDRHGLSSALLTNEEKWDEQLTHSEQPVHSALNQFEPLTENTEKQEVVLPVSEADNTAQHTENVFTTEQEWQQQNPDEYSSFQPAMAQTAEVKPEPSPVHPESAQYSESVNSEPSVQSEQAAQSESPVQLEQSVTENATSAAGIATEVGSPLDSQVIEEVQPGDQDVAAFQNLVSSAQAKVAAKQNPFLVQQDLNLPVPEEPLPTLELLYHPEKRDNFIDRDALEDVARLVESKLADYKIKADVVGIYPGPVITRFELDLAPGVKVSRISGLSMDLARALSAMAVRVVEVIPGKPYVGLELPNMSRQTVFLSDVISSPQFEQANSPTTVVLGQDIAGEAVIADIAKMPHVLVAGTTGSGKSVGVNVMILSMLYKASPEDLRFIMIDPKMLELSIYEGIPHLLAEVVTDMKDASNALRWCVGEMERRYKLMSALGVRNVKGFNEKLKMAADAGHPIHDPFWQDGDSMDAEPPLLEKLPYIVVVVDEFADLMMVVGKKVEELIARLAQKARAAGIHLILATQRPSVDVITGLIKANIPTRVAFTVSTKTDSRTILDQGGAESLLGMGDMLYLPPGSSHTIRVHGAFASDDDVHAVVNNWKARGKPNYIDEIISGDQGPESLLPGEQADSEEEMDPLFDQVVEHVVQSRRGSVSGVQRRFKIGYNRAARIVEQLEAQGIVSSPGHNGNREVLAPAPPKD
ncbi:cell division protein FtsK [Vibrio azureus]|uniref:DNA translocase FtsK n=1 Tax=Vibrio azureus NBRC 104587 TaxID=1219077 RepID=U3A6V7_9VIBR|nr:DNA translocase FtsK [Vibrio azureus]AUI86302.1 cell division protein FtsK [Vibrio azureus]GAD75741.1 hypothetical protein VAZ01S_029_00110 [Vibrio azureus NBRC 104587]